MPVYTINEPLKHNGTAYAPGETVEMEPKAARELLALGVLAPAAKVEAKAGPKPAAKLEAKVEAKADSTPKDDTKPGEGETNGPGEPGEEGK